MEKTECVKVQLLHRVALNPTVLMVHTYGTNTIEHTRIMVPITTCNFHSPLSP
jgi:hypothetical protein